MQCRATLDIGVQRVNIKRVNLLKSQSLSWHCSTNLPADMQRVQICYVRLYAEICVAVLQRFICQNCQKLIRSQGWPFVRKPSGRCHKRRRERSERYRVTSRRLPTFARHRLSLSLSLSLSFVADTVDLFQKTLLPSFLLAGSRHTRASFSLPLVPRTLALANFERGRNGWIPCECVNARAHTHTHTRIIQKCVPMWRWWWWWRW